MLNSVKNAIKRYNMINGETEVTVALSGGADSVALLLCLLELKEELHVNISAAHLNHCLRGEESDRDEQFVRELCKKFNVPLTVEKADVNGEAIKTHESIELCARRIRYDFLKRVSVGLIATAHTANDNTETVLHNLARGTGISGLCGIPPVRDNIIRPLILTTREQVEAYCGEKGISFCVDSTNSDESFTRNFIRHSVVPKLNEVNSATIENVANMSASLRDDDDFLQKIAKEAFDSICDGKTIAVNELCKLHPAIRSRCIVLFYKNAVGRTPEYRHVKAICDLLNSGGKCSVQNDFSAVVKDGKLKFLSAKSVGTIEKSEINSFPFCDFGLKLTEITGESLKSQQKFNSLFLNNAIDCDKICGKLILRGRVNGDEIRLSKRKCTKSLKKLFQEAKIEEILRDSVPVLADDNGIVFVAGFGVAERCQVDESSKKIILVRELE